MGGFSAFRRLLTIVKEVHIRFPAHDPLLIKNPRMNRMNTSDRQYSIQNQRVRAGKPEKTEHLKKKELLTEERYREYKEKASNGFKAKMGAEAIRELLKELNLNQIKVLHISLH